MKKSLVALVLVMLASSSLIEARGMRRVVSERITVSEREWAVPDREEEWVIVRRVPRNYHRTYVIQECRPVYYHRPVRVVEVCPPPRVSFQIGFSFGR